LILRGLPDEGRLQYALTALFLAAIAAATSVNPGDAMGQPVQKRSKFPTVSFGENSKLTALPAERNQIQAFYRDVLGCSLTKTSESADIFQLGRNFYLGVVYHNSALRVSDRLKSIWLELRTDRLEELKAKILQFGNRVLGSGPLLFPSAGWTSLSCNQHFRRHVKMATVGAGCLVSELPPA
jgi:hypothetical protein